MSVLRARTARRRRTGGSSIPSITTRSWLSASCPPPIMPPGIAWFTIAPTRAGALELLAGLPERDDPAHLLLGLRLPADVVEPDAPPRVAGLVGADLRDPHRQQRPEEDHEVREEEDRQADERVADVRVRDRVPAPVPDA